ncbi:nuclear transport factor 2 family protein [Sphingomonas sp. TX0543]
MVGESDRIAIEWACTTLINRYALLNDAARWEEVAAMYAQDGSMTRPTAPDAPIVGRSAILAAFQARPPRTTRHVVANVVVDVIDETHATASSAMLLFTAPDAAPLVGGFEDRLVLTHEGWRFAERRGTLTFQP